MFRIETSLASFVDEGHDWHEVPQPMEAPEAPEINFITREISTYTDQDTMTTTTMFCQLIMLDEKARSNEKDGDLVGDEGSNISQHGHVDKGENRPPPSIRFSPHHH